MNSRQWKQKRRAELFGAQNGCCFWCEETMLLMSPYPMGGTLPRNACTLDHLRDRDNPLRRDPRTNGEARLVAACFGCNHDRDVSRMKTNSSLQRISA